MSDTVAPPVFYATATEMRGALTQALVESPEVVAAQFANMSQTVLRQERRRLSQTVTKH